MALRGARRTRGVTLDGTWLAIVNPAAGGGRGRRVLAALQDEGCLDLVVHQTRAPGQAQGLLRELRTEGFVGLLVVGGDGSLHEVLQGLLERPPAARPPLGLMPAGTGDALARDLGLAAHRDALHALRLGRTRWIDLARVTVDDQPRHCISVVGWGAFARINRRAERWRWARGRRYDLAAAYELFRPRRLEHARARRDGRAEDLLMGVACLTEHTGRGMRMAPGAVLDDGQADLVEVARGNRLALAKLLGDVFDGAHVHSPLVHTRRVASFELELDPGSFVVLDGEALPARRVGFEMIPRALEIFAPPPA